jgi:hypothetical protein
MRFADLVYYFLLVISLNTVIARARVAVNQYADRITARRSFSFFLFVCDNFHEEKNVSFSPCEPSVHFSYLHKSSDVISAFVVVISFGT